MNQTALKNSDQNVSQQIQNIAATHATPPGLWPLTRCFRMADGLNTITRRGEIASSVPGLRGTADTLTSLEIFRHGFIFHWSQRDAHRGIGMRAWFGRLFINAT